MATQLYMNWIGETACEYSNCNICQYYETLGDQTEKEKEAKHSSKFLILDATEASS